MINFFGFVLLFFWSVSSISAAEPVTLMAVGDVMLGRSVGTRMLKYQDWRWPFWETASGLQQADLLFGNLESPFGQNCTPTDQGMKFCADHRSIEGLAFAGFDVLSLVNNHMYDQGSLAQGETKAKLAGQGIVGLLPYEVVTVDRGQLRLAFIAVDDTMSPVDFDLLQEAIADANTKADQVIVSIHWGVEYTHRPQARQLTLGRQIIDAGADLIIGHHPHWVQAPEMYRGKIIIYSLGNFVFDQMWSDETRLGWVAELVISKSQIKLKAMWPVMIFDYGQPRWLAWVQSPAALYYDYARDKTN